MIIGSLPYGWWIWATASRRTSQLIGLWDEEKRTFTVLRHWDLRTGTAIKLPGLIYKIGTLKGCYNSNLMCDVDLESGGKKDGALCHTLEVVSKIITRHIFGGRMWDSHDLATLAKAARKKSVLICVCYNRLCWHALKEGRTQEKSGMFANRKSRNLGLWKVGNSNYFWDTNSRK